MAKYDDMLGVLFLSSTLEGYERGYLARVPSKPPNVLFRFPEGQSFRKWYHSLTNHLLYIYTWQFSTVNIDEVVT